MSDVLKYFPEINSSPIFAHTHTKKEEANISEIKPGSLLQTSNPFSNLHTILSPILDYHCVTTNTSEMKQK